MLAGAGFGTAFIYALMISLVQLRIISFKKTSVICRLPEDIISIQEAPELRFDVQRGFPVLPGCSVKIRMDFHWNDRSFSGCSDYNTGMSHCAVNLKGLSRGVYSSGGVFLNISDALGLFRFSFKAGSGGGLSVGPVPRFSPGMPVILGSGGENISRVVRRKRSDELTESRQYYPGDDVRRINWRAYAHTGQLFIRLGEDLPRPESHLLLIIDLSGAGTSTLKPEQLDSYLDLIVDSAAGLAERLNDSGVIVDCIIPPGKPAASDDPAAFAPLWWDDSEIPPGLIGKSGRGACLLVCPAFSARAEALCSAAAENGLKVSVMVPVPEQAAETEESLLRRLVFISGGTGTGSPVLRPRADELLRKLKRIRGVVSVETL